MRLLRIHAPGADPRVAESVSAAVREFNAGLDIRLRFLAIGIEEVLVEVSDAAQAAAVVGDAIAAEAQRPADLALLLGDGEAAVAAASTALRAGVPLVRADAGRREGRAADAGRAIDQMATLLLVRGDAEAETLRAESVRGEVEVIGEPGDAGSGTRIVRAITRARRRERC